MILKRLFHALPVFSILAFAGFIAFPAQAQRDASFVPPSGQGQPDKDTSKTKHRDIVAAEPDKIDTGETLVNVTKHVTLIFSNIGAAPAKVESLSIAADGNVQARLVDNNCDKTGVIDSNDRCTVGVDVTPNSAGPWTAEVLLMHDQPGHVAEASLNGNTLGETKKSDTPSGLAPLGKSTDQVDFGNVVPGYGTSARTVLLVNNSATSLQIQSIDLVAADKSLSLLDSGCKVGMDIAPSTSCPITVLWSPKGLGNISTDLIIRHTGPVGFVVIPVRGVVGGTEEASGAGAQAKSSKSNESASNFEKSLDDVTAKAMRLPVSSLSGASHIGAEVSSLKLKGTVGEKAIIDTASGDILIASVGDTVAADGSTYTIVSVAPQSVIIERDGIRSKLVLATPMGGLSGEKDDAKTAKDTGSGGTNASSHNVALPGFPNITGSKG